VQVGQWIEQLIDIHGHAVMIRRPVRFASGYYLPAAIGIISRRAGNARWYAGVNRQGRPGKLRSASSFRVVKK
jgi:hypothetical protein